MYGLGCGGGQRGKITQRATREAVSGADESPALLFSEMLASFLEKTQARTQADRQMERQSPLCFSGVLAFATACCVTSSPKLSGPSKWVVISSQGV